MTTLLLGLLAVSQRLCRFPRCTPSNPPSSWVSLWCLNFSADVPTYVAYRHLLLLFPFRMWTLFAAKYFCVPWDSLAAAQRMEIRDQSVAPPPFHLSDRFFEQFFFFFGKGGKKSLPPHTTRHIYVFEPTVSNSKWIAPSLLLGAKKFPLPPPLPPLPLSHLLDVSCVLQKVDR